MTRRVETPTVSTTFEAELCLPAASVQLARFDAHAPVDNVLYDNMSYRLDLSLTPRLPEARFCFADRWAAHRFEQPGKLFLLPPGETVRVRTGVGRQESIVCNLPAAHLKSFLGETFEWNDRRLAASLDLASGIICNLLLQIGEETRNPSFASEMMIEGLALQVAACLQRHYLDIGYHSAPAGLSTWRLKLIDERLQDQTETPDLAELATLCRLSVRQLTRGFRASRGLSLGAYVAEKALDRAKQLLAGGESVKAVSRRLGFASSSSFCYAFRKSTGLSPREYCALNGADSRRSLPAVAPSRPDLHTTTSFRSDASLPPEPGKRQVSPRLGSPRLDAAL